MKNADKARTTSHSELQAEFELALLTESTKAVYVPSPVLVALDDMLIKTKRIAKVLGVPAPNVSDMLNGRRPTPAKYEEKLLILLRDAVRIGRKCCVDAEVGKTKWNGKPFPKTAIEFMQKRIAKAEAVLKQHEKSQ